MKKQNHPKKFKSTVIQKDGSSYVKNWLVKKNFFELDFDLTNHPKWKWKKKKSYSIKFSYSTAKNTIKFFTNKINIKMNSQKNKAIKL